MLRVLGQDQPVQLLGLVQPAGLVVLKCQFEALLDRELGHERGNFANHNQLSTHRDRCKLCQNKNKKSARFHDRSGGAISSSENVPNYGVNFRPAFSGGEKAKGADADQAQAGRFGHDKGHVDSAG